MGFPAYGTSFAHDYACPALADTVDFKLRDSFDGVASLFSAQLSVMALKHRKGWVALTQTQYPTPGMRNHTSGLEHQLLHHRLDATTLGLVAQRCIGLVEGVLSNQAQQIHRHRR